MIQVVNSDNREAFPEILYSGKALCYIEVERKLHHYK